MKLDRSTLGKLGMAAGGYNTTAKQVVSIEQSDNSRAEKIMTNKTPIHGDLTPIVAKYMQRVQNGEITMEEAAEFINKLPSEPVLKPVKKPKTTKQRKNRKLNTSLREQLSKVKLK